MRLATRVIDVQRGFFDKAHATATKTVDHHHAIFPTTLHFGTSLRTLAGTNPGCLGE